MRYIYIIIVIAFLMPKISNSQYNLVPNPSFEEHQNDFPDDQNQLDDCHGWKSFNSSDWISSNPSHFFMTYDPTGATNGWNYNSPYKMNAHTGTKFLGFGPCEGGQIELLSTINKYDMVTISFWFSPRTMEDTEINLYLLENQAGNSALNNCFNPNIDTEFHEIVTVNSSGVDAIHIPGVWYYCETEPFIVMDDKQYEWFAIKGENINGDFTADEYVMVDDIKVISQPVCDHICSPNLGVVSHNSGIGTNVLPNATYQGAFHMDVYNATEIEFKVFNRWGANFYTYYAFDHNGLDDPVYPGSYMFSWLGVDDNGNLVQQGVYSYNLKIKNCTSSLTYIGESVTLFPQANSPCYHLPAIQNHRLDNCCEPNATYNNITFQNGFRKDVNDYIHAGTGGPTIVPASASVQFFAGNSIVLGTGFHAIGNFSAKIAPCGVKPSTLRRKPLERLDRWNLILPSEQDSLKNIFQQNLNTSLSDFLYILPNPSNGQFVISSNVQDGNTLIEIFDMKGIIVSSEIMTSNTHNVDISSQPKGIYIIRMVNNNKVISKKIVLK